MSSRRINPKTAPIAAMELRVDELLPSPENDRLYRPVDPSDAEVRALAASIQEFGVREPLVVTSDGYLLSGHRRLVAARLAGLKSIPCRVEPFNRGDDLDRFLCLLREHNRQRVKSAAEQVREEVVSMNPDAAHAALLQHRVEKSDLSEFAAGAQISAGARRARFAISRAKTPMLGAVQRVLVERQAFWPLSDRSIHYALLNHPPLRHASKPDSRYVNDRASYQDLTNLLTRARLAALVPWQAIGDETRPVKLWRANTSVQPFVRRELSALLTGYWRDYQQGQTNHIEIVAEKLSVRPIVQPLAEEYCLPLTIGRGYCSIMPRYEMARRFQSSGRERLVLIMLADFDPDGEAIAQSFVRSMRDDFGIESVRAVKAALTHAQIVRFELPPQMKAKAGSATYADFTSKHGDDVYELEALAPAELQSVLRETIRSVLDLGAFNRELARERADAVYLEALRRRAKGALLDLLDGDDDPAWEVD